MKSKLQAALLALAVLLCSVAVIVNFSGNPQMPATVDTPEPPEVIAENYNITSGSPLIANEIIDNLTINGGYPTIQNCTVHNRVIVKGGSPTFIGNVIEDGIHADAKEGPVTITDNTIFSKSSVPNIYLQGIHADVSGNEIVGNFSDGIYIYLGVSSASIKQNLIYNCQNGIYLFTGVEQQSEIIGNAIFNNSVGITNGDGEPLIKNNTVTQNVIGIECYRCIAQYNNIYNNSKYNFENPHLIHRRTK
ncbi:MAG: right-handed parallel beta-helix repeat-containing protein [Candidatus Bathyarchaeota archaeon]|nr:right-handed parallel beta-helix repeat-containing protein [Candidatus Bathyarchaeota archaeon]